MSLINLNDNSEIVRVQPIEEIIERMSKQEKPSFIWPGIRKRSLGFVFGAPKSGKTITCECLGMSIAAGCSEYLGLPIEIENRKVLFISLEEFIEGRTERNANQIAYLKDTLGEDVAGNYIVANEKMPMYIDTKEDWNILSEEIEKVKPGVVIIDSLSKLTNKQLSDEETAKAIMRKLRELTHRFDIALIVINHTPKGASSNELTQNSMSGSSFFLRDADFVYAVNKTSQNERYIKVIFFRYAKDDVDDVITIKINDKQWIENTGTANETSLLYGQTDDEGVDGRFDDTNQTIILEFLKANDGRAATTQLLTQFVSTKIMGRGTMFANLKKLTNEGEVILEGRGIYRLREAEQHENEEESEDT